MGIALKRIIFFGGLLLIWTAFYLLGIKPETLLPSPWKVVEKTYLGFKDMTLVFDLLYSFRRLGIGLTIGLLLGIGIGILLARWKTADETLGLLVLALQSVPSIV